MDSGLDLFELSLVEWLWEAEAGWYAHCAEESGWEKEEEPEELVERTDPEETQWRKSLEDARSDGRRAVVFPALTLADFVELRLSGNVGSRGEW